MDKEKENKSTSVESHNQAEYRELIDQVHNEYKIAYRALSGKITEWLKRLKLYNNQRRDKAAVGDTTLFTVQNTIVASLYDDRLSHEWFGTNQGDDDIADNLNHLSQNDYVEMEKDMLEYDWIWDTCFFGRGLVLFDTWDSDTNTPLPEAIDPTTFLRDTRAVSIRGNRKGMGAARFFGREIRKGKNDMKGTEYFDLDNLRYETDVNSLLERVSRERDNAQGIDNARYAEEKGLGDNMEYRILQWWTTYKGKKVMVELANNRERIIRYKELKNQKLWPVIDRSLYPISHDWDGVSVPDIVEDKQRARAVIQNLALKGLRYKLYPSYLYDEDIITNKADLENVGFNKFIGAKGVRGDIRQAITPLPKEATDLQLVSFILGTLDASAQKATATPEIQQGTISKEQRTLGELNIVASKVDTRYSLSAKIFGWSERRFWLWWYSMYKQYFKKDIKNKVLRIEGAYGAKFRTLGRENIISDRSDLDVKIESKILQEAKRIKNLREFREYIALLLQDPNANRRYAIRKLGRLHGFPKDEVERLLPMTTEEMIADKENELLNENKKVSVKPIDIHLVHLEIHSKAADTPASYAHIETHKEALRIKRERPDLFPENPEEAKEQAMGGNTNANVTEEIKNSKMLPNRQQQPAQEARAMNQLQGVQ
jgi:hypothetical protein